MSKSHFTDQIGHEIELGAPPKKIVSLVPSQTELLFNLGLEEEIVGVTKFCIHPADKAKSVKKIGGTKKFNFKLIDELEPDLILANKEENYLEGIQRLQQKYQVWTSDILNLSDALHMINSIGILTRKEVLARNLSLKIHSNWDRVKNKYNGTVLYLIWQNPLMGVAGSTFIDYVLSHLGFENILSDITRYPELMEEQVTQLKPDYIFLSSEPFPFRERHISALQKLSPESKVILVDGEMFSWYGNRLLKAIDYFEKSFIS